MVTASRSDRADIIGQGNTPAHTVLNSMAMKKVTNETVYETGNDAEKLKQCTFSESPDFQYLSLNPSHCSWLQPNGKVSTTL